VALTSNLLRRSPRRPLLGPPRPAQPRLWLLAQLRQHWPDLLVGVGLLYVLVLIASRPYSRSLPMILVWALFAANWLILGRHAVRLVERIRTPPTKWDTPFLVGLVATGAAAGYFAHSSLFSGLALPMIWLASRQLRRAVLVTTLYSILSVAAAAAWFALHVRWPPDWSGQLPDGRPGLWPQLLWAASAGLITGTVGSLVAHIETRLLDTQQRLLAAHREAGVQAERARLAQELHDTVTQDLTGLVMLASRARRELGHADDPEALRRCADSLELIEQTARSSLEQSRALVSTTLPVKVTSTLADAVRRLAGRVERETGARITVTVDESIDFTRENQVLLLRCVQEGLANIRKHARAQHVEIDLARLDAEQASLTVADDGVGPAESVSLDQRAPAEAGFGLIGLRDRLTAIGGTLTLDARPGGGSLLTIRLPFDDARHDWTRLITPATGGRAGPW